MIIEIAFDLPFKDKQLEELEAYLVKGGYVFYVEPPNNFISLEDVECQCEGK